MRRSSYKQWECLRLVFADGVKGFDSRIGTGAGAGGEDDCLRPPGAISDGHPYCNRNWSMSAMAEMRSSTREIQTRISARFRCSQIGYELTAGLTPPCLKIGGIVTTTIQPLAP